ncbi:MAG: TSUP family transporter [Clostridium sp.]
MELTITTFLIVCPMVFLAGLLDSIAGGGGLISLPAYLIAGIPPHMALGTNKLSSVLGTSVATFRFAKEGFINLKKGIWFIAAALVGSSIGANLTLLISEKVVGGMMIIVLPVVAFYVLKNKKMGDDSLAHSIPKRKSFWIALAAAFFVGTYDGFYGPGTGTFLILILTGAAKYTMKEAAGTTKMINLSSSIAAIITFLINGKVVYSLGLAAGLFGILGNYMGAGMVLNNGQKIVRPLVLFVLVILFAKVLMG